MVQFVPCGRCPNGCGSQKGGLKGLLVPVENAREAAITEGLDVLPVRDLGEALDFLERVLRYHVL